MKISTLIRKQLLRLVIIPVRYVAFFLSLIKIPYLTKLIRFKYRIQTVEYGLIAGKDSITITFVKVKTPTEIIEFQEDYIRDGFGQWRETTFMIKAPKWVSEELDRWEFYMEIYETNYRSDAKEILIALLYLKDGKQDQ